jgi:hypothetical protein
MRLVGRLRGELDAIALKALALRPADRYANVAALAEDLQCYLKGERVLAVPERITTETLVAQLSRNPNVRVRHRCRRTRPRETRSLIRGRPERKTCAGDC